MKLSNEEVAKECEERAKKYSALSLEDGSILFSYELQGYVKSQIEKHKEPMDAVLIKIMELIVLIKEMNR
jgi:hypothetical protein